MFILNHLHSSYLRLFVHLPWTLEIKFIFTPSMVVLFSKYQEAVSVFFFSHTALIFLRRNSSYPFNLSYSSLCYDLRLQISPEIKSWCNLFLLSWCNFLSDRLVIFITSVYRGVALFLFLYFLSPPLFLSLYAKGIPGKIELKTQIPY